ncbi:hypothetical protein ACIQMP_07930 [Streptomyces sp. NPDC091385]|uniref:hypothetical protein n=1 Tax=Streptomyces sp. NPDC091385 TaxID=3365997 RepID=UPI00382FDBA2
MTDVTPTARATILGEAADALGHMDYDVDSSDYGYDSYRDAWDGGVMDGAALLRRMADAASPQPQAEGPAPGAELRETANFYEQVLANMLDGSLHPAYMAAIRDVICGLRRRADEAVAADGPTAGVRIPLPDADECGPNCPCRRSETEDGTATDEDRATRRTTIREKLDLLGQRGILGRAAVELLRELVEAEIREGNAAREERESLRFSLDMAQGRLNGLQQMHATTVAVNGTIMRELKARTVCTCAPPRAEQLTIQVRRIADALTTPIGTLDDDTAQRAQEREYAADIVRALKRRHEAEPGPAGKEDMERAARRSNLYGLLARLDRNTALTREESDRLRDLVNTEIREANTAREVARGNLRHVRHIAPEIDRLTTELEQAHTTLAEANRVMDLQKVFCGTLRQIVINAMSHREDQDRADEGDDPCVGCGEDHMVTLQHAIEDADRTWAATFPPTADGPARPGRLPEGAVTPVNPVTTAPEPRCTATITDPDRHEIIRCTLAANHYRERLGPDQSWHDGTFTDGQSHLWADYAAGAVPHQTASETPESS